MNEKLTIYYDGSCPLCSLEMDRLKKQDKHHLIVLINLRTENFNEQFPHINIKDGLRILHGEYKGNLLLGLDVTHRAWTLVGKGYLVAPLQWPIIKPVSHLIYLFFAKYRYPISRDKGKLFNLKTANCHQGTCYEKQSNSNHWRK